MTLITALKSKNKIQGEHTGYIQIIAYIRINCTSKTVNNLHCELFFEMMLA